MTNCGKYINTRVKANHQRSLGSSPLAVGDVDPTVEKAVVADVVKNDVSEEIVSFPVVVADVVIVIADVIVVADVGVVTVAVVAPFVLRVPQVPFPFW